MRVVVQSFLENSHPAIQSLESLQSRAMEEFSKVASFFGEDSNSTSTDSFFAIFAEFVSKFEVSGWIGTVTFLLVGCQNARRPQFMTGMGNLIEGAAVFFFYFKRIVNGSCANKL